MGVLANIKQTLQRGASSSTFRFPTFSTGQGGGLGGGYGYWNDWLVANLLPGSDYDYIAEAGDLWKCSVVAACLNFLMNTFCEPRLAIKQIVDGQKGVEENWILTDPLLALLNDPNQDDDDLTYLLQTFCMDWNLYGNVYWLLLRNNGGKGRVIGIQYIPRRLMKPIPDPTGERRVAGYAYYIDGKYVMYDAADIVHFKFGSDPNSPREGLSPLLAACRDICTENELSTLAAAVARNMGIVPYLIGPASTDPDAIIDPDTVSALEQKWDARRRDSRGKPIFMRQAYKVDKIGMSPQEMMADETRAVAVSRICAALRVDPMVIGLPSSSKTYANLGEAHRAVYDHNILPMGRMFCERLNRRFRNEPGFRISDTRYLAFDTSLVRALQEDQTALHTMWREDFKAGVVTRAQAKTGIGVKADPADETVYFTDLNQPKPGNNTEPDEDDPPVKPKKAIKSGDDVTWITVGGRHIPIGEDGKPLHSGHSGAGGTEETPSASAKSMLAKQSAVYVGADIQRYAEEHNEPGFAKAVGGLSLRDNEPVDVIVLHEGVVQHGIELKTMVSNANGKITMKASAMEKKAAWMEKNHAPFHTVVFDDQKVFNANGQGKHGPDSGRQIYYKRGFGSFRVSSMHPVKDMAELTKLMNTPDAGLPAAAKPPASYPGVKPRE